MEDCKKCKEPESVPYIVHEMELARAERMVKRLWITTLILIFLLVGTNAAWLWYESQWQVVEYTQEVVQEAESGTNNFVGGDVIGEADGEDNHQNPKA